MELKNPEPWKRSIDAISAFISEGNFRFNDKGVSLRAIDPSQIVLVDYFLGKEAFDKYNVEPTFIGVDLGELSRVLNRLMPNDRLKMDLTDSEMIMTLTGALKRNFRLSLIDVSDEEVTIPKQSFDTKVEIDSKILKEALKDASLFGSSVVLRVKEGKFLIEARGSQGALNTSSENSKGLVIEGSKEVVSKYSLNSLINIVKEADGKVLLELKSDSPMRVSYTIGKAPIQFYLAHMIL